MKLSKSFLLTIKIHNYMTQEIKEIKEKLFLLSQMIKGIELQDALSEIQSYTSELWLEASKDAEAEAEEFWQGHRKAGDEALSMLGGRL